MGCPVPKICKTGAGAALLADPAPPPRSIEAMVRAVDIPVTVKMRRGLTPDQARPAETARRFESGRRRRALRAPARAAEEYGGTADHRITAEVVAAVSVPVIASGDIAGPDDARRVIEETGCAAIAVGRAALGNPWVFGDILRGAPRPRPGLSRWSTRSPPSPPTLPRRSARTAPAGTSASSIPGTWPGTRSRLRSSRALLAIPTVDAALGRLRDLAASPAAA